MARADMGHAVAPVTKPLSGIEMAKGAGPAVRPMAKADIGHAVAPVTKPLSRA
ncbi:MAG: hypothetical protein ACKVPY_08985 [Paracoccaceae bacterium]